MKFAKERFPDDALVQIADMVFEIVPQVLKEQGKAKNPAPNVDAISGTLQYYYGVQEFDYLHCAVRRQPRLGRDRQLRLGACAGQPIERPKSLTMKMLEDVVAGK